MYFAKQVSFMHKPIHYYVTFVIAQTMYNVHVCCFVHFAPICIVPHSTSSSIKKLTCYNSALRRLLLIEKPYVCNTWSSICF